MSNEVVTKIVIDAPPRDVWDVIMDASRLREWVTIHKSLGKHSEGSPHTGDHMEQTLVLRGAPFKVKWELVVCEDAERAEWHGVGPARSHAETEYRLEAINGGGQTCFHYRNVFKAPLGPLGRVASKALVGGLPEKEAKRSLAKLKALLENR